MRTRKQVRSEPVRLNQLEPVSRVMCHRTVFQKEMLAREVDLSKATVMPKQVPLVAAQAPSLQAKKVEALAPLQKAESKTRSKIKANRDGSKSTKARTS